MNNFDYGQVVSQGEAIKGARTQNAMNQQRQQMENTKILYSALTRIAQDPMAADEVVPQLKQMGIMSPNFDYSHMSPEEMQAEAAQTAQSIKAGLDAYASTQYKQSDETPFSRDWNLYSSQPKDIQNEMINFKRANRPLDVGSGFQPIDPVTQQPVGNAIKKDLPPEKQINYLSSASSASEQGKQDVRSVTEPQLQADIITAKKGAEKAINKPKQDRLLSATGTKTKMLGNLITKAKSQATAWTTGFIGDKTKDLAGSPAHDLNNTLNTIKSNIGFDKLQEMRDSSPTGGALGQVTEMENKLLQSVWGALEQSQSKQQFRENLDAVNKQIEASWDRIRAAYKQEYGVEYSEDDLKTRVGQNAGQPGGWVIEEIQ